jgi:hypothetical protein
VCFRAKSVFLSSFSGLIGILLIFLQSKGGATSDACAIDTISENTFEIHGGGARARPAGACAELRRASRVVCQQWHVITSTISYQK